VCMEWTCRENRRSKWRGPPEDCRRARGRGGAVCACGAATTTLIGSYIVESGKPLSTPAK
jgi:hypothetical protein